LLSLIRQHKYGLTQQRMRELLDKRNSGNSFYSIKKLINNLVNKGEIEMINYQHVYVYKVKV